MAPGQKTNNNSNGSPAAGATTASNGKKKQASSGKSSAQQRTKNANNDHDDDDSIFDELDIATQADVVNERRTGTKPNFFASASGLLMFSLLIGIASVFVTKAPSNGFHRTLADGVNLIQSFHKQWNQPSECENRNPDCEQWAKENECALNPAYMHVMCSQACGLCKVAKDEIEKTEDQVIDGVIDSQVEEEDVGIDDEDDLSDEEYDDEDEEDGDPTGVPRFLTEHEAAVRESESEDDPNCIDTDEGCEDWADRGECETNPGWMLENCQKSCNSCVTKKPKTASTKTKVSASNELCNDADEKCDEFVKAGECDKNPIWMTENCPRGCGKCAECTNNHKDCFFWAEIGECEKNPNYMLHHCKRACLDSCKPDEEEEADDDSLDAANRDCKDRHPTSECQERFRAGECDSNPGWTIVFCAKSCGKCDLLPQKARCVPEVWNDTSYVYENALKKPGDLNAIFKSILKEYPTTLVLSQPPQGPWVIKLPKFVTEEERDTLLNMTLPNVKRSTDQGGFDKDGIQEQIVSTGRTSSNAWCLNECEENPIVKGLTERVSQMVKVPVKNFESYQVLQYKRHQKYDVHHDSSDEDQDSLSGPRILTFFIYMSDVDEGGETAFDKLGLKVKPERGSAILWPSVLDDDPKKIDWRTTHAALPVIRGEKLAANLWIHMRDFDTANKWGCTGAFDE